ncbi:MAG: methionyl-tRNA formyltransferase [Acholeplasmataceae bacterium]
MKLVFMGTPQFATTILKRLIKDQHDICLVVTQPDKAVGRKKVLTPSPVKLLALSHHIEVFQPVKIKDEYQKIIDLKPDFIITAAYGQILPKALLDTVKAINVHGSLLPQYRGGAPIQKALFDGLNQTGVTIMYMAYQMDSGDIIKQQACPIEPEDDYLSLSLKLAQIGADALSEVLNDIKAGIIIRKPQDPDLVTFAFTLKRSDEYLDFHQKPLEIINKMRGLSPEPGAFTYINNQMIKLYKAKKSDIISNETPGTVLSIDKKLVIGCIDGAIEVEALQIPGKRQMNVKDFLNGQTLIKVGDICHGKDV